MILCGKFIPIRSVRLSVLLGMMGLSGFGVQFEFFFSTRLHSPRLVLEPISALYTTYKTEVNDFFDIDRHVGVLSP